MVRTCGAEVNCFNKADFLAFDDYGEEYAFCRDHCKEGIESALLANHGQPISVEPVAENVIQYD